MRLLQSMGYQNVSHYAGGMEEWTASGGQIERRIAVGVQSNGLATVQAIPKTTTGRIDRTPFRLAVANALGDWSSGRLIELWLAVVLIAAVIYWFITWLGYPALTANQVPVDASIRGFWTALYFSFVTVTSVGYGDAVPVGIARPIAIVEAITGLIVFGAVIAKFVSRRQDEIVNAIHRITYEERLDRVQTNLHLVLSELQDLAETCSNSSTPIPRITARLESTVFVFGGELRTIHTLLYHPESAPDEAILRTILAGLGGCLRSLDELMGCIPEPARLGATSSGQIAVITRLAEEICADCVPQVYAPGLRALMDAVQTAARQITRSGANNHAVSGSTALN